MKETAQEIIDSLGLEAHMEGGFYRRTYQSNDHQKVTTATGERFTMTSIYYLLSRESPLGYFHRNRSDIVHFFHAGDPIQYFLISPEGELKTFMLGQQIAAGQHFQYTVLAGWWKASCLLEPANHGYGLISEAVSPGFDYADMELASRTTLSTHFPQHQALIHRLTRA